ncbi:hypothetical protein SHIRM173S_09419 [Streptomyces hirsutus]
MFSRAAARARAFASSSWRVFAFFSCPRESKSRPCATRLPSTVCRRASSEDGSEASPARPDEGPPAGAKPEVGEKVPVRSQYSAERNAMRSRSRSTTSRVATDWTRPADSRGMTFFHRTGETS